MLRLITVGRRTEVACHGGGMEVVAERKGEKQQLIDCFRSKKKSRQKSHKDLVLHKRK